MKESLQYILEEVQRVLERVKPELVDDVVESVLSAQKIFIYGVGRSGLVGKAFAVRLVQMGLRVYFVGDMTTPIVEEGDLVMIVSNTGETMSAVQTANITRRVGAKVIGFTSNQHSKLAQASNVVVELSLGSDERRRKHAPLGTIFEDACFLLFDSLVPVLMNRLGLNESSLRRRHAIWV